MFVLELGDIVDVLINHDPDAVALAVRRDVVLAECLCHGGRSEVCRGGKDLIWRAKGLRWGREIKKKVKSGEAGGRIYGSGVS